MSVRVVHVASLQFRHETLHPMSTSLILNTLPQLDIPASDTKLFNLTTCNASLVASPKQQRCSAVVEACPKYSRFCCYALYGCRLPADGREHCPQGRWPSSRRAAGLVECWDRAPVPCTCGCTQTHCTIIGPVPGNLAGYKRSHKKTSCGVCSDFCRQHRRSVSFRTVAVWLLSN